MGEISPVRVFSADVVLPITAPPIEAGSVATQDGRILECGNRDDIASRYPGHEELRWSGILMPGLVNAHTHLQYTGFAHLGQVRYAGFEDWSRAFDEVYAERFQTEDWYGAATAGAEMALRSGTTTIADICTDIEAFTAIRDTGLSGCTYYEIMGWDWGQWQQHGREHEIGRIKEAVSMRTANARVGISPHAPYSLDTPVLADVASLARWFELPSHTHLAESTYEDAYYRTGEGPLADFVETFGRQFEILREGGTGLSSAEFARSVDLVGEGCHVAHGIYLGGSDRALLRDSRTPVALCPRSNAVIGLDPAPIADYLREGSPICVGTDSLASSPSLDLLEDVRLLRDLAVEQGYTSADLSRRLVAAATIGGARALRTKTGRQGVGSLESGKRADFAVFAVESSARSAEDRLVEAGAGSCVASIVAGELRAAHSQAQFAAD